MTKLCRECHQEKPITDYYIRKDTNKPQSYCKPCVIARANKWRRSNKKRNYETDKARLTNSKNRFIRLCTSAAKREIAVNITIEDWLSVIACNTCDYCSGPLPSYGHGLDRKDSSLPYSLDNIVPCCTVCNMAKGNYFSYIEFKHIAETIRMINKAREWLT